MLEGFILILAAQLNPPHERLAAAKQAAENGVASQTSFVVRGSDKWEPLVAVSARSASVSSESLDKALR